MFKKIITFAATSTKNLLIVIGAVAVLGAVTAFGVSALTNNSAGDAAPTDSTSQDHDSHTSHDHASHDGDSHDSHASHDHDSHTSHDSDDSHDSHSHDHGAKQ